MNRETLNECVKWGVLVPVMVVTVAALLGAVQFMISAQTSRPHPDAVTRSEYQQLADWMSGRFDRIESKIDQQWEGRKWPE